MKIISVYDALLRVMDENCLNANECNYYSCKKILTQEIVELVKERLICYEDHLQLAKEFILNPNEAGILTLLNILKTKPKDKNIKLYFPKSCIISYLGYEGVELYSIAKNNEYEIIVGENKREVWIYVFKKDKNIKIYNFENTVLLKSVINMPYLLSMCKSGNKIGKRIATAFYVDMVREFITVSEYNKEYLDEFISKCPVQAYECFYKILQEFNADIKKIEISFVSKKIKKEVKTLIKPNGMYDIYTSRYGAIINVVIYCV